MQGIHSSAVVVSCGCWDRLSPTLSSNNPDVFSHSSGGQEFKIGFTRLPGCRGVEGGLLRLSPHPVGRAHTPSQTQGFRALPVSVCGALVRQEEPAGGLAPSLRWVHICGMLAPVACTAGLETRAGAIKGLGHLLLIPLRQLVSEASTGKG